MAHKITPQNAKINQNEVIASLRSALAQTKMQLVEIFLQQPNDIFCIFAPYS